MLIRKIVLAFAFICTFSSSCLKQYTHFSSSNSTNTSNDGAIDDSDPIILSISNEDFANIENGLVPNPYALAPDVTIHYVDFANATQTKTSLGLDAVDIVVDHPVVVQPSQAVLTKVLEGYRSSAKPRLSETSFTTSSHVKAAQRQVVLLRQEKERLANLEVKRQATPTSVDSQSISSLSELENIDPPASPIATILTAPPKVLIGTEIGDGPIDGIVQTRLLTPPDAKPIAVAAIVDVTPRIYFSDVKSKSEKTERYLAQNWAGAKEPRFTEKSLIANYFTEDNLQQFMKRLDAMQKKSVLPSWLTKDPSLFTIKLKNEANHEFSYSCKIAKVLGKGGFGSVVQLELKGGRIPEPFTVAFKISDTSTDFNYQVYIKEIESLKGFGRHPSGLKFYGAASFPGRNSIIVMEDAIGSFDDLDFTKYTEGQITQLHEDALNGMEALHATGLVHLDMKVQNLLVSKDVRGKVIDFGFCRPAKGTVFSNMGTNATQATFPDTPAPPGLTKEQKIERIADNKIDAMKEDVFETAFALIKKDVSPKFDFSRTIELNSFKKFGLNIIDTEGLRNYLLRNPQIFRNELAYNRFKEVYSKALAPNYADRVTMAELKDLFMKFKNGQSAVAYIFRKYPYYKISINR